MPWLLGTAIIWVGSKVVVNATESVENVADASNKAAGATLMLLGAFIIYKKLAK